MKKLLEKDKQIRKNLKKLEKQNFVFKMIQNNANLSYLTRFSASNKLNKTTKKNSKTFISNRCIATVNKKKFGKFTNYSRIFFFKLARNEKIYGLTKAAW